MKLDTLYPNDFSKLDNCIFCEREDNDLIFDKGNFYKWRRRTLRMWVKIYILCNKIMIFPNMG